MRDLVTPMLTSDAFKWLARDVLKGTEGPATGVRAGIALLCLRLDALATLRAHSIAVSAFPSLPPKFRESDFED